MPDIDFAKIKKLPPEKRVRVLQELEEELNRLIEERKGEIEEAEAMLEEAKRELRILEEIETPKLREVDVARLFRPEEAETAQREASAKEASLREQSLEQITSAEQIKVTQDSLMQWTADRIYRAASDIYQNVRQTGMITADQEKRREYILAIEQAKKEQISIGQYNAEQTALEKMARAESMMNSLKGAGTHEFYRA